MREQILELRRAGKSYKEICQITGCSKGTVSYHCGEGQKEKKQNRQKELRKRIVILRRVESFQYDRRLSVKTEDFQRERIKRESDGKHRLGKRNLTFRWRDVINKFGWETICYLTGEPINLREPRTYHFDHIVPIAKGGVSTIDNLGICTRNANQAKHDMSKEELLVLCEKILKHHGYTVIKN